MFEGELDQFELTQQICLEATAGVVSFNYFLELIVGRGEVFEDGGSHVLSQLVKVAVLKEEDVLEGEEEGLVGSRVADQGEQAVVESNIDALKCLLAMKVLELGEVLVDRR